jgi:hypothetical protein
MGGVVREDGILEGRSVSSLFTASSLAELDAIHRLPLLCLQPHRPRYRRPSNRRLSSRRRKPNLRLHHQRRLPAGTILLTRNSLQTPATSRRVRYSGRNDAACALACDITQIRHACLRPNQQPETAPKRKRKHIAHDGHESRRALRAGIATLRPCRPSVRSALRVRRPRRVAPRGPRSG